MPRPPLAGARYGREVAGIPVRESAALVAQRMRSRARHPTLSKFSHKRDSEAVHALLDRQANGPQQHPRWRFGG